MQSFFSALTWVTMGLLVPCVSLLFYFLIRALVLIGQEWQQRKASSKVLDEVGSLEGSYLYTSLSQYHNTLIELGKKQPSAFLPYLINIVDGGIARSVRERQLGDFALSREPELSTPRLLIRLGPSLGLIGTLIPMGPALAGLANGDLLSLSQNMQVAFSTTVLGVLIGGIGYVIYQSRKYRFALAMHKLEFTYQYVEEKLHEAL